MPSKHSPGVFSKGVSLRTSSPNAFSQANHSSKQHFVEALLLEAGSLKLLRVQEALCYEIKLSYYVEFCKTIKHTSSNIYLFYGNITAGTLLFLFHLFLLVLQYTPTVCYRQMHHSNFLKETY